jgi:DNA helicase-2/ATP-dependent DNA helicase PcrA
METKNHPAYIEECQHLEKTIKEINQEITNTYEAEPMYAPPETVRIFTNEALKRAKQCKRALKDLYFGRVDWQADGSDDTESFYIGLSPLYRHIIAWQETLASDLYYNQNTTREKGELHLVRTLLIKDAILTELEDNFQDASLTGEIAPDSLLAHILSESRGMLNEIVATINAQQNRIIRAPLSDSFIVQGVPGSGKTVIALHRISYLLYNYKELRSQNVLILGPNPIFMKYVSQVLPSLGERRIPQKTFDSWVMDQLGEKLGYQSQEGLLEFWLSPEEEAAEKVMHLKNCQNMGSLQMGIILDRYVDLLQDEVLQGKTNFEYSYDRRTANGTIKIPIKRTVEHIASAINDVKNLPFNKRRGSLELKLTNDIVSEILRGIRFQERDRDDLRKQVFKQIEEQVHLYFSSWRDLNVSVAYRKLFRQPGLLRQLGGDIFNRWDLELMSIDAPTALTPFRFSDLVGLLYFKLLLEGTSNESYGHIVVDEAQDIPPLFFKGLSQFTPKKSITILGDTAQGVFINNGMRTWDDLYTIFPSLNRQIEELKVCYRSTYEIMSFANDMLRRIGTQEDKLILPLNRKGHPVGFHPCDSEEERVSNIIKVIKDEIRQEHQTIAVICKSALECQTLAEMFHLNGFDAFTLIDNRDRTYQGGVIVIPAYLAKGLEFDTVIIADSQTYLADELSVKLLFVAITRAAHSLQIFWLGEPSPLLDSRVSHVEIEPFLADQAFRSSLTIGAYSHANRLNPDWCMEAAARAGLLPLMTEGEIDPVVMDLLVLQNKSNPQTSTEDTFAVQLSAGLEQALKLQIHAWEDSPDSAIQGGLAFTQTIFGLFKNHIRNLGLLTSGEEEQSLVHQVILLVRLWKLLQDSGKQLPAGRWSGVLRLQDDVDHSRLEEHKKIMEKLIDYGIVERQTIAEGRSQVRVNARWNKDLLNLALGHPSAEIDPDLLRDLLRIPQPLDLFERREAAND